MIVHLGLDLSFESMHVLCGFRREEVILDLSHTFFHKFYKLMCLLLLLLLLLLFIDTFIQFQYMHGICFIMITPSTPLFLSSIPF